MADTQQQDLLGAFLFICPAVIIKNFAPFFTNLPPLVQQLLFINPLRYVLIIVRGVNFQEFPLDVLFAQFWQLALISFATYA